MQYGGPYLGIMACREKLVRRMPGRIAGQTVDRRGKRCFVLTLQTREQHIRREKATSNVCTNQGLFALRATIYLALLGPHGLQETANLCLQKSRYAAEQLCKLDRFELAFSAATFKEFVIRDRQNQLDELLSTALEAGFLAGVPLGRWYPELHDCLLVAVTEKRTMREIDDLASTFGRAASRMQ
jgi:glycine dehydrogenase subunit 1